MIIFKAEIKNESVEDLILELEHIEALLRQDWKEGTDWKIEENDEHLPIIEFDEN